MPDLMPSSSSSSSLNFSESSSSLISESTSSDSYSDFSGAESDEGGINNWKGQNLIIENGETENHPYINFNIDNMIMRPNSILDNTVLNADAADDLNVSFLANDFYGNLSSKIEMNVLEDYIGETAEDLKLFPIAKNGHNISCNNEAKFVPGITIKTKNTLNMFGSIETNIPAYSSVEAFVSEDGETDGDYGQSVSISGNKMAIGAPEESNLASDSGAVYIYSYDENSFSWTLEQTLVSDNAENNGFFGYSVSLDGDKIVVGAYQESGGASDSGRVYVYEWNGSTWNLEQTLASPNFETDGFFGYSVSLDGDRMIIGAYRENGGATDSGRAYIYTFSGGSWTIQGALPSPNPETSGYFGYSVSISGTKAIIGAYQEDGGASNSGRAYIYDFNGSSWSLQSTFTSPNVLVDGYFGYSVSISEDKAIIGAYRENSGSSNDGRAYIYDFNGSTWSLQQSLVSPNFEISGNYGWSVSISGDKAIIGAIGEDGGDTDSGRSYVYDFNGTSWDLERTLVSDNPENGGNFGHSVSIDGTLAVVASIVEYGSSFGRAYVFSPYSPCLSSLIKVNSPNEENIGHFGRSVSISGTKAIVGASQEDGGATNSGRAYIYDFNGTSWDLEQTLVSPNPETNGFFGYSVSISETKVIVGAYGETVSALSNAGRAYIYDLNGSTWSLQQTLVSDNPESIGYFGWSVSISGDNAIVGAYLENGGATDSGRAYIYDFNGISWDLKQTLASPNFENSGYFGYSVSISETKVIIGAYREDSGTTDSGRAYIYDLNGSTWSLQQTLVSDNPDSFGYYGYSVSISGTKAIIGAYQENGGNTDSGRAYIYDFNGSTWSLQGTLVSDNPDLIGQFGYSVSISGTKAIVGANQEDAQLAQSGRAYAYDFNGTTWSLEKTLVSDNQELNGFFGHSVSLDGDNYVIGAYQEDGGASDSGRAYFYHPTLDFYNSFDVCLYSDSVILGEDFTITNSFDYPDTLVNLKIFANTFEDNGSLDNLPSWVNTTIKKIYILDNPWVWGNGTNLGDYDKDQSWGQNWSYEGTNNSALTFGDNDTGQLRVRFGESVVSNIMDMTGTLSEDVEMFANETTSGTFSVYIRGWTTAESYLYNFGEPFDRTHDETEGLTWSLYSTTFSNTWRYMQIKLEVPPQ